MKIDLHCITEEKHLPYTMLDEFKWDNSRTPRVSYKLYSIEPVGMYSSKMGLPEIILEVRSGGYAQDNVFFKTGKTYTIIIEEKE
jgi:hypothetical protein